MSTCPRCGRPLRSIPEIAGTATDAATAAVRLLKAHGRMKLAVPSDFLQAMRELEAVTPRIAEALACHAGTCSAVPAAEGGR